MKIKKLLSSIILVFCILFCASCDPSTYYYDKDYLTENIQEIRLIDYTNEDRNHFLTWTLDQSNKLKDFNLENIEILSTLEVDKHDSFIESLCSFDILYKYYAYDSPKGICVMIVYKNGNFDIINCEKDRFAGYIGTYDSNGNVVDFIGCFSSYHYYEDLISDYFEYEV
ncbi:MAG: hypothetical protein IJV94_04640 [Bacilli bacterium]|nr:hypothetical protein [Bacilli bacterium]